MFARAERPGRKFVSQSTRYWINSRIFSSRLKWDRSFSFIPLEWYPGYLFSDGLTKRNISIRLRLELIFIPINYLRLLAKHPKSISEFFRLEKGSRWYARLCETKWKRKAFPFIEAICRRERSSMWKLQLFALFVWLISSPYARRFIRDYTQPYPSLAMSSTSKRNCWLFSTRPSLHSRIFSEVDDQCKWILSVIKRTEKLSRLVSETREIPWIIHVDSWETVNEKLSASYYDIGEAHFTSITTCEGGTDSYRGCYCIDNGAS